MREVKFRTTMAVLVLAILALTSAAVFAVPAAPVDLTNEGSERRTQSDSQSIEAQAGNVTALSINALTITTVWQGYFGNITGTITLDDASNNTFYNWTRASPTGEIYVSRGSSPTWSAVVCGQLDNITTEETSLTISDLQADGINETFTKTTHDSFSIGTGNSFATDECNFTTNAYSSSGAQDTNWDEILLVDGASTIPVYATLIAQDAASFQGGTSDFEILVPTNVSQTTTTYYFFVELS